MRNCQCKVTRLNTQFSAEGISLLNLVMSLFSLNSIRAIKLMISLEMKCPQLSKPEATAAWNQNCIGDRSVFVFCCKIPILYNALWIPVNMQMEK